MLVPRRAHRFMTWSSLFALLGACSGAESSSSQSVGGTTSDIGGAPSAGTSATIGGSSAAATGGANATGGFIAGGALATGGLPATGGSKAASGTGGAAAGGAVATGGAKSTGGTNAAATGGNKATGGVGPTGGSSNATTGGSKATGGALATGGAITTGGVKATGGAAPTGGVKATGGAAPTGGATSTSCTNPPAAPALIGWGNATTGGGNLAPVIVTSASAFSSNVSGSTARVILIQGPVTISGSFDVGSNKTIVGTCGAVIHGHLELNSISNVIIRNITVQGNNCTDSPSDCSGGADAISVRHQTTNVWIDHSDIYDGSDGNLDITNGADMVTVSWTKFHYTGRTDPANQYGHQFSNLVGGSDSNGSEDSGHLNVTWHHNWWATNVKERMPRVRFGKNHVFNNLYTCSGDQSAMAAGVNCNVRAENNVFVGVANPIDLSNDNSSSILQSSGNVFTNCTGSTSGVGGNAFTPTYSYTLDATSGLQTAVQNGAGPH